MPQTFWKSKPKSSGLFYLLHTVYFTILLNKLGEITLRRLVRSVNKELEIKWKETIVIYVKVLNRIFPAGTDKHHKTFQSV
jgi:hypothetical protein